MTDTFDQPAEPSFEIDVLPLINLTLFPETFVPLTIGRPRSVAAVEAALASPDKLLGTFTRRVGDETERDPRQEDVFTIGTLVTITRMERVEDTMRIVAKGIERIRVLEWKQEDPNLRAVVQILPEPLVIDEEEVEATRRHLEDLVSRTLKRSRKPWHKGDSFKKPWILPTGSLSVDTSLAESVRWQWLASRERLLGLPGVRNPSNCRGCLTGNGSLSLLPRNRMANILHPQQNTRRVDRFSAWSANYWGEDSKKCRIRGLTLSCLPTR